MPANDCYGLTNCKNGIKNKFPNKKVEKKLSKFSVPRRAPIQVLSGPNAA